MTIEVIQLIEEAVSPVALISAIERDSSVPKNALIVSVMPSDFTAAEVSVMPSSKEFVTATPVGGDMPDLYAGNLGLFDDQISKLQNPILADITLAAPSTDSIQAIERDASVPKNALIVSVMASDRNAVPVSVMGDSQDTTMDNTMAVNSIGPQVMFLHAVSDLAGNAVADQKMRGGT
jgi:hypothetical protein